MVTRLEILNEREAIHGSFEKCAKTWAMLHNTIDMTKMSSRQELAMTMIFLKMARAAHNPNHKDNWVDIAGYAHLAAEACEELVPK